MKKHKYKRYTEITLYKSELGWVIYKCIYCNKIKCLNTLELKNLPKELAKCSCSNEKATLRERLKNSYNCLYEEE